jgi:hypothetical protein
MQRLSESLKSAIQGWQGGVLELWPPAAPERIDAVLGQIGQKASADVLELYTTIDGFGGMDGHGLSLWSLDEILEENAATGCGRYAFADGLVESFRFQLQYENELVSSVWIYHGEDLTYRIADSLARFFEMYLAEPGSVCLV